MIYYFIFCCLISLFVFIVRNDRVDLEKRKQILAKNKAERDLIRLNADPTGSKARRARTLINISKMYNHDEERLRHSKSYQRLINQ